MGSIAIWAPRYYRALVRLFSEAVYGAPLPVGVVIRYVEALVAGALRRRPPLLD